MEREILFRAWDKENKKMLFNVQYIYDSKCDSFGDMLDNQDYIITQFTGLKDEEGTKIFEGDIVKHDNGKNYEVKFGFYVNEVNCEYTVECYGWHIGKDNEFEDFEQIHNSNKIKVIGNIFENPELLK